MLGGGFVLTGGKSSRMGQDKALLGYHGGTLVEWVAGLVRQGTGSVQLVGAPERYAHIPIPCLPELYPGCGPLSGIEAALRLGGAEWSLIVACDMPGLDPDWLRGFLSFAQSSGAAAVLAVGPRCIPEPLCAVYHADIQPLARAALERGDFRVRNLLNQLQVAHFPTGSGSSLLNINSMEDWTSWSR